MSLTTEQLENVRSFSVDDMFSLPPLTKEIANHINFEEEQYPILGLLGTYQTIRRHMNKQLQEQRRLDTIIVHSGDHNEVIHHTTQVLIADPRTRQATLYTLLDYCRRPFNEETGEGISQGDFEGLVHVLYQRRDAILAEASLLQTSAIS